MTISLLDRLDNITIPDTPIPEEDIAAVNELQEDFYRELQDMEDAVNALQQLGREGRTRWLQAHLTTFAETLNADMLKLRADFAISIIGYFNTKYTLGLSAADALYDLGIPRPHALFHPENSPENNEIMQAALDYVVKQLNGRSLAEAARSSFVKQIRHEFHNLSLSSRAIIIPRCITVYADYDNSSRIHFRSWESLNELCRAITAFVTDFRSYSNDTTFPLNHQYFRELPQFGKPIPTGATDKHPTVTLYKNGNARLTFQDEATAKKFLTTYGS